MDDTIYRQEAIRLVHSVLYEMMVDAAATDIEKPMSKEDKLLLKVNQVVCTKLREMPSEEPVRKGKWGKAERRGCMTYSDAYAECSCCHGEPTFLGWRMNYCPNCGADMRGEEE